MRRSMDKRIKNIKNKNEFRIPCVKTRLLAALGTSILGASLSCFAAEPVVADRALPPVWSVSGFGTLGVAYHDEDDTLFRRSVDQRGGARSGHLETRVDSLLGLQLNGQIDGNWSVMGQIVSRQDIDRKWTPQLTWGFVKYAPNDWSEFRVGRMAVDIYLDGDSRHVGYSYTTVRPYADVYGRLTYDTFDGGDAVFQRIAGDNLLRFKLFGGRTRGSVYMNGDEHPAPLGRTFGVTLDWIRPELSLKLSWGSMVTTRRELYGPLRTILREVAALGIPQAGERADEIGHTNRISYLGAGVAWERGPISLQVVGTEMSMSVYPGFDGWGLGATAAYRAGAWKPYITYSRSIFDSHERVLTLPPAPSFLPLQNIWRDMQEYARHDQYTVGAGVRYDFADNAAFKLQVDRIEAKRSSSLLDDRGFRTGPRGMTLFSATIDFVF